MGRASLLAAAASVAAALIVAGAFPHPAAGHGLEKVIASSYLARISQQPRGLDAKVIDGDQRMWLRVPPAETVTVLDYRGAPYLRFSRAGVLVNRNSVMYYLNQTPFAQTPPSNIGPRTAPAWEEGSGAHEYSWHDGRLAALVTVARAPGATFVGRWSIPLVVDGRAHAISGGLWHAQSPSIVWFWPIVVLISCVLALWRVRRPALDRRAARLLGIVSLAATTLAALAQGLHGRPTVAVPQLIELALILIFVAWALSRVLRGRAGHFTYFLIAFAAMWQGLEMIPTLFDGFVLAAVPAILARSASVVCIGAGAGLLLIAMRLGLEPKRSVAPAREA
ncbi:MAG: hypothetical protein FWD42_10905 [Solirubrobacterales bacterium]|nr:hypothetical protein [Solirubrobacterales bacterium]